MAVLRILEQTFIFAKRHLLILAGNAGKQHSAESMKKRIPDSAFIHIFALLHAATALLCRAFGLQDDLMLTVLTMSLIIILCFRMRLGTLFMAIAILVSNVAGYFLGALTAHLIGLFTTQSLVIYPLSTLLTTEILGWVMYGFGVLLKDKFKAKEDTGLFWLMFALVLIIVARLVLILPLGDEAQRTDAINIILNYFFSCTCLVCIAVYALRQRRLAEEAHERENRAQYRYMSLKQQVNPHFLFNSLNSLDYLINERPASEASAYTHKLSDIYRYMLRSEDESLVSLRDELSFVRKYCDLLKLRFPEGLEISIRVNEQDLSRCVVPCCVQLLVENATKHNAVRADNPLRISIVSNGKVVRTSNNLCPKVGRPSSTGLGLEYIRTQYRDLTKRSVLVEKTATDFIVEIPLI